MVRSGPVVVVGQGYVGLPLSMLAIEAGHTVVGLDTSATRIDALSEGASYVEDISNEQLAAAVRTGRFRPTTDYADASNFAVAVITVPTPLRERSPDLTFVDAAGRALAPFVTPNSLVILESTTYPGTTEDRLRPILEEGSGLRAGPDFSLGFSPERIDPGNRTWTLATTPKVVSGIDDASLQAVKDFYGKIVADVVPVSSPRAAELTKLLENTFRHVNIALVNELAMASRGLGINVWEVIAAAATKPFGFMPFTPGPGVGGHCLPIDPSYLSWQIRESTGKAFRFVELANDINDGMPDYVVQRLMLGFNELGRALRGSVVLMLGMSYKKNSSDMREAPAMRIATLLRQHGADVRVADSQIEDDQAEQLAGHVELSVSIVRHADVVLLVTDHDDFDYSMVQREARWILDCRHRLVGENVERL